ncbi:LytTR family DNA-binding domain-containing protein [Mucilaginibacter sp. BJC16-A38]|uniref:LytR/AlgR family response regulator transcription factor n=1 Tax=Mucilaginibacter phenanthrenivorans TaxID=1234842 RepID=UPI00215834EA|nr:LytTR family DNA-binding domain-containing protein [Mucilaginibacter phenanthrenivorans]MCR8556967.1 LytTR family DNA-binding domain-containing protein [Mucilaginibacter phenanthrenivorans]
MIRCVAIDDEFLALEVIENYVGRLPFLELAGTFTNALEALPLLTAEPIDLMFLDIEMPDINGLAFLKTLKKAPMVIFTTAYSQFAAEGFEVDAVDYLIKPIPFDRFLKGVQKAQQRLQPSETTIQPDHLFIKSDYKTLRVALNEILYIEGMKDYVCIHTTGQSINTLLSITALLEKLPLAGFVRVHRSFVIALNKINSIERNTILIGAIKIPVGDQYRDELMKRISP